MTAAPLTPSPDETPAVDAAETASGHPHTQGVEYTDDETLLEVGEAPDVETHENEVPPSVADGS